MVHTQEVWIIKLPCALVSHPTLRSTHTSASEMSIEHLTQKNPFKIPSRQQLSNMNLKIWQSFPSTNQFRYLQGVTEVISLSNRSVTKPSFPRRKPTPEGRLVRLSSSRTRLLLSWWARISFLHPAPESYPLTITSPKVKEGLGI